MKAKVSRENVLAFLATITERHRSEENWADRGTEFAEDFERI